MPSRPAFKACLLCLHGMLCYPFTWQKPTRSPLLITWSAHANAHCNTTLAYGALMHAMLLCLVSATATWPKNTCLRLTPLHCRAGQPQHASVQRVSLLSRRGKIPARSPTRGALASASCTEAAPAGSQHDAAGVISNTL